MPDTRPDKDFSVRKVLRQATHPHHIRLHNHPILVDLTQPELSLTKYRKILRAYSHFYAAVEGKISVYLTQHPCTFPYGERYKLPWLKEDLAFFHDDMAEPVQGMSQTFSLPEIETAGQFIGVLYTIEGSTLGGQAISRSLAKHHGLTSLKGARFFNGYGENTSPMWENFLCFTESISDNDVECGSAVKSACDTFQAFEQTINKLAG